MNDEILDPGLIQQLNATLAAQTPTAQSPVDPTTSKLLDQQYAAQQFGERRNAALQAAPFGSQMFGDWATQQPSAQPTLPQPSAPSYGMLWPVSKDAQGNRSFDINAGLPGMVKRSVTLPYDVYTGAIQTHLPGGQINPELVNRSIDFATLATPLNPAIRAGDLAIPGVTGAAMTPTKMAPPTAQALKDAASSGYTAARNSGIDISGEAVADLGRNLQSSLEQDGIIAELAPKTHAVIGKITNPPEGGFATIANIEAMRRSLSHVAGENATDNLAASRSIREIDNFLETLAPKDIVGGKSTATITPNPGGGFDVDTGGAWGILYASTKDEAEKLASMYGGGVDPAAVIATLRDARGNYAAAQRSNTLTGTLDNAATGILERAENRAQATNSGRNLDNAIRQRIASILEKPREISGFSDTEIAALEDVLQGGSVRNMARVLANVMGGGGGLGAVVAGGLGGLAGGAAVGTTGAAIGMGVPLAGAGLKMLENALAKRSLRKVDETVRQNSPLSREMMAQQILQNPAMTRDRAVLQSVLPGIMGGGPQPQQRAPFSLGPPWI